MSSHGKPLAIVTGASRGIGREVSRGLLERGHDVLMIARDESAIQGAARALASEITTSAKAEPWALDVSDEHAVAALAMALAREGRVPHVLVNNAGIVRRGPLVEDTPIEDWDRVMSVNLRGQFLMCRAFLREMKQAAHGRVVFVGSISSTMGCPNNASYGASKWGLVGLMKSVAEEARGSGVVVTAILPGSVDTDMLVGSGFPPAMSAGDVASAIVNLATDAPTALHGSAIEMFG